MGWSIPTYAGQYALGSPSKLRTGLFELCRAVNEREAALGFTDGDLNPLGRITKFTKTNGTTAINVSMADILNLPCTGINSYAETNMKLISGRIKSLCPAFTTISGGTTPYTVSSLETAIGASLDNPTRFNEARWWQACQDALDLLIHPWGYMARTSRSTSGYTYTGSGITHSTVAAAWSNRGHTSSVLWYTRAMIFTVTP